MEQLYPIGIQTFEKIRANNFKYIDKTEYVYRMTHSAFSYAFLSRPRRFGKSLLVSTLHSYFEGRRDLFGGLAIERLETEWRKHPVLHFDMSLGKHLGKEALERNILSQLADQERRLGIQGSGVDTNVRLKDLIQAACEKAGEQAVVLIDEYDAPLLDVVHEDAELPTLRNVMRNFYSPLKACDPYLRFVFLTGITKFSQLSIFSELNNIKNISMDPAYAAICGITEEEMLGQLAEGIDALAEARGLSREEAVARLKAQYDGYHFTWPSPDVYNPHSLLNALADRKIDSYWFGSGTPTYLVEMLRKFGVAPSEIGNVDAPAEDFDAPTERMTDITPLLYQSGYLTIKDHDDTFGSYRLDIPNTEVRLGLMRSLLPSYVADRKRMANLTVINMARALYRDDMDGALRVLKEFLGTVPYCDNADSEGHYQQMLYVIFSLLGCYADVEVRTPTGRVDMALRTATRLYVVELKMGRPAAEAMGQIDLKGYPARFALCGLPVVKVGIGFDPATHNISDWAIVPAE